jgi:uncharacterized membrane protein
MWTDEMLTYQRVTEPLSDSFDSMTVAGNQTPLYYLVLRLLPKTDPLWLRFPSVAFGLLDIVLLAYMILRLYGDKSLALQAAALVAIHPMHIILSRTARYYTLLLALTIINLLCFVLILRGSRRQSLWALLGLSSLVAYLTHYTTLALPAAQFVTLLLGNRDQRRLIWKWGVVQFLAVLPLVGWMLVLLKTYENTNYTYQSQFLHLRDLPISWLNIALGFDGDWSWVLVPGLSLAVLGLLTGIYYALCERHQHLENITWVFLVIIPVLIMAAVASLSGANYRDRYFLIGMPSIVMLMAWGWEHYSRQWRWVAFAVVLLTSIYLSGVVFSTGAYQRTDWYGVTSYMEERYQSGDVLLFERPIIRDIFAYYAADDPTLTDNSLVLFNRSADDAAFTSDANHVWVIYRLRHEDIHRQGWEQGVDPFTPRLSPLSDWLREHQDQIVSKIYFDGVIIFEMALTY